METYKERADIKYDRATKTLYLDSSMDFFSVNKRGKWFEERPYDRMIVSGDFNDSSMSMIAGFKEPVVCLILEICSVGDGVDNVVCYVRSFYKYFSHWTCNIIFGTTELKLKKGSVKYYGHHVGMYYNHEMVDCGEKDADVSIGSIHRRYIFKGTEEFEW